MPLYLFKHPDKEEFVDVLQGMNDEHVYFDEDGVEWERRWTVPQACVSSYSSIDPFDTRKAAEVSGNKKGSVGDLWDLSKEMGERREDKLGHEDPKKRAYFEKYKRENNGAKHMDDRKKVVETKHAIIDFDAPATKVDLD